jgi:hypothetical protein
MEDHIVEDVRRYSSRAIRLITCVRVSLLSALVCGQGLEEALDQRTAIDLWIPTVFASTFKDQRADVKRAWPRAAGPDFWLLRIRQRTYPRLEPMARRAIGSIRHVRRAGGLLYMSCVFAFGPNAQDGNAKIIKLWTKMI